MRRLHSLTLLGALALGGACADALAPAGPARLPDGLPGGPAAADPLVVPLECTADVVARSVSCKSPSDAQANRSSASGLYEVVIGGQNVYVSLGASNTSYDAGTGAFSMDVTVQNLVPQTLGTTDGTTPHADGVRIFFSTEPVATAGSGTITIDNEDGSDTFTAANQPYYMYDGALLGADAILAPNEVSGAKAWQFTVPCSVTKFTFTAYVYAEVPEPNGYVDITGISSNLPVGAAVTGLATVRTVLGDVVPGAAVTWSTNAPSVATIDADGLITAVAPGPVTITATSGLRVGTFAVNVCPNLAVGESYVTSGADAASACFGGGVTGQEFVAIPFNAHLNSSVSLSATGSGIVSVTGPPTPLIPSDGPIVARLGGPSAAATELVQTVSVALSAEAMHLASDPLRRSPLPNARTGRMVLGATGGQHLSRPSGVSEGTPVLGVGSRHTAHRTIVPGVPSVGDTMDLSVTLSCNDAPSSRIGVVRSVSTRAVIVADTANPPGGFTTAQYDSISLEFDSIAYVVNEANFGAPTDLDANQRVVIFYTSSINALSPPASSSVVLSHFRPKDLSAVADGCPGSNEGEIIYALVPDPTGAVNSNVRTVSFVRGNAIGTLTHELQHLISASHRLHVLGTTTLEAPWLDEAMSRIAEELAFYRTSVGLAPAQNIVLSTLTTGPNASRRVAAFNTYANGNYGRLRSWLQRPDTTGPTRAPSGSPSIAAQGVAWAFLRYAADRKGGSQAATWAAIVSNPDTGRTKLASVLGIADIADWQRDFVTAMYADDAVAGIPTAYQNPSWNYRSLFGGLNGSYQLVPRPLTNGVPLTLSYASGGASYLRFGTSASSFGTLSLLSGGAAPPATVHLVVLRTK